jgi:hypothetical protein
MIPETEEEPTVEIPDLSALIDAVQCGLRSVEDLEQSLESLDALLLTGRPHAIADAAMAVELSLLEAEPVLAAIGAALDHFGMPRLQDAAQQLRRSDQGTAAATVDGLRTALKRFARRNDARHRRAQGLGRGLGASLRTLHALGMAGNGRLIAEA